MAACRRAVTSRHFREAERHLREAARHGAPEEEVARQAQEIRRAEAARAGGGRLAVWAGFGIACIGYLVLSFQQPAGWGEGVWAALAFLLIPALAGLVMSRIQRGSEPLARAFFSAMKGVGRAMLLYAAITLIVLAHRVGRPDAAAHEFIAAAIVVVVYSVAAGAVAGLVNLMLTRLAMRKENDGPAPG
jgi:hypothetical protein